MTQKTLLKTSAIIFFYLTFLLVGLKELRINFSQSFYGIGDILYMFQPTTFVYLFSLPIWLLFIQKLDNKRLWMTPLFLTVIIFVVFPLAQYPRIFHNDTLWHLSVAKDIVNNGKLVTSTGYEIYPGAFLVTSIFSDVLALPLIETSIALSSFWVLLMIIFLLCFGRLLTKINTELSGITWLLPTIFLAFNFIFYNNYHYSPQLMGLCLYVIFLYACFKKMHARSYGINLMKLILLATITITHVFSGFFSVMTLLCINLCEAKTRMVKINSKRLITLTLLLFGVLIFLSWHSFVAIEQFTNAINSFSAFIKGEKTFSGIIETVAPGFLHRPELGALLVAITYYRYGVYICFALLSLLCLLLYWCKAEVKLFFWIGFGILLGGIVVYLTPATWGVSRIIHYGGVVISSLSSYVVIKGCKSRFYVIREISTMFKMILPFILIVTFLVANLSNCTYTQFVHTDEIVAMKFVVEKNAKQISMLLVDAYIIRFFMKDPFSIIAIDDRATLDAAKMTLENGELSFQYLPRLRLYYNISFVEKISNLIYSNGLTRIYAKSVP